jgi:hypothetical protein
VIFVVNNAQQWQADSGSTITGCRQAASAAVQNVFVSSVKINFQCNDLLKKSDISYVHARKYNITYTHAYQYKIKILWAALTLSTLKIDLKFLFLCHSGVAYPTEKSSDLKTFLNRGPKNQHISLFSRPIFAPWTQHALPNPNFGFVFYINVFRTASGVFSETFS